MANDDDKKPIGPGSFAVQFIPAAVFVAVVTQLAANGKLACLAGNTQASET